MEFFATAAGGGRRQGSATKWRSPAGLGYTDPVHYIQTLAGVGDD